MGRYKGVEDVKRLIHSIEMTIYVNFYNNRDYY